MWYSDRFGDHNFVLDEESRRLVDRGTYFSPVATQQCSISFGPTLSDIEEALRHVGKALAVPEK
jgi:hypothetical protein